MAERSNEPTVYNFDGAWQLRAIAVSLGATSTYSTKKVEFFRFANGRKFLLEPDRGSQLNIGFQPGLNRSRILPLVPSVGKNSNVKSHWNLATIEFDKIVMTDQAQPGTVSVTEARALLERLLS